jgi:DNA-binding MarR family transcriptional regulator
VTAGRSQPATSHLVAGLERRRLVERAPDPRDARRTQVRATAAARRIASRVERVRMQGLRTALRGVPAPTVRRFEEALAGLLEAMEKTR